MKKFFLRKNAWAMLACAMVMFSCSEEERFQEDNQMEFTASLDYGIISEEFGNDSRTSINETSSNGFGIYWMPGDKIGVYTDYEQNVEFTSINTTPSGSVKFGGYTEFTLPKTAYYPYTELNNDSPATEIKGEIPAVQQYHSVDKRLTSDWKVGVRKSGYADQFSFRNIFSLICVKIDATSTPLENDSLVSVTFELPKERQLTGNFTFDISGSNALNNAASSVEFTDRQENCNTVTLEWTDRPKLVKGKTYIGYMSVAPAIKSNDKIIVTVKTKKYTASFERSTKSNYVANNAYTYTLALETYASQDSWQIKENITVPAVEPVLKSMKFEVAKNSGKILPGYVKASNYKATYQGGITEQVCTIDDKKVSLYLPYLNNRKLVPTFDIPEGTTLMTEAGETIVNGETVVDFSVNKKIKVVNSANEEAVYDVELTNTGLPVVVVNQGSALVTSASDDTQKGSSAWYTATKTGWQPKNSDWVMNDGVDNFMVYYADGTPALTNKNGAVVNEPVLASTRVRGNVSQQMPKKPFAVKLDKSHGIFLNDNDASNDMKSHKRWVLLAGWNDRSMMRNAIAYDIAHLFEKNLQGGIGWNTSVQHVELVYNGVHVGNYLLGEQIKIDENRLDIKDAYDKDDAFTSVADYGYLLESDDSYDEDTKFITRNYVPFLFKDDADANGKMLSHVKSIVEGIEENLYNGNYSKAYETLDLNSMVDFLLIQEVLMNGELKHPKSVYSYIVDGVMYAGPIWDFDWQTIPNISVIDSDFDNAYTGGSNKYKFTYTTSMLANAVIKRKSSAPSQSELSGVENYMWYPMLVKDGTFKAKAKERWDIMSAILTNYADNQIPVMANKIKKSQEENWKMWPLQASASGRYNSYNVGGGFCGDEKLSSYDAVVELLITNLKKRINGMSYVSNQTWPNISTGSNNRWNFFR